MHLFHRFIILIVTASSVCACPIGCEKCDAESQCTSCKNGFYGNKLDDLTDFRCTPCSTGCISQCDVTSGMCDCRPGFSGEKCDTCVSGFTGDHCDQCTDGFYGPHCDDRCSSGCRSCFHDKDCTSCFDGYYLLEYKSLISECVSCLKGCVSCSNETHCTSCSNGFYLDNGRCRACSTGCYNDQCDPKTGSCNCKFGFEGERCSQCNANFRYFPDCDRCVNGFFGSSCNNTCHERCLGNECNRGDGRCSSGCVEYFTGDCTECVVGRYGQDCDKECPENCDGGCGRYTGICDACKGFYNGDTCEECRPEVCGDSCNFLCPRNCVNDTYERSTGSCINDCVSGFSGDMCCLAGPNCQSCQSPLQCVVCLAGKYGNNCDIDCPQNCEHRLCHLNNGSCIECEAGYYGDDCASAYQNAEPDSGLPGTTLIGATIGGGCVVVVVVVVVLIVYLGRVRERNNLHEDLTDGHSRERTGSPTYVNEVGRPKLEVQNESDCTKVTSRRSIQNDYVNTKSKESHYQSLHIPAEEDDNPYYEI